MKATGRHEGNAGQGWRDGLELARALAILLVVYAHGLPLLEQSAGWRGVSRALGLEDFFRPGWWGVRIFFALSGYLIGQQIIGALRRGTFQAAANFVMRRWLRTIPTYWFLLVLAYCSPWSNWSRGTMLLNALFLQTASFNPFPARSVLDVAWSLAIEEWSYLLLGGLAFASAAFRRRPSPESAARGLLLLMAALLACATLMRFWAAKESWINWESLKKSAPLQLDSLAMGVGLACLEILRPRLFSRLIAGSGTILVITLLAMSAYGLWLNLTFLPESGTRRIDWFLLGGIGYPVASLLSCAFLLGLWRFRWSAVPGLIGAPLRWVAAISYSLYLVHLSIGVRISEWTPELGGAAQFLIYAALSLAAASVCWLVLERPCLALRKRFK